MDDLSPEKFRGKYRIASARLQGFDYGSNGAYFVTICTKNRTPSFGEIKNKIMGLSELGIQVWKYWYDIPNHFPFVVLDEFVVMPDHVHGILFINKQNSPNVNVNVETQNLASLHLRLGNNNANTFGPQSKNLASIIRGFKIGITKYAREIIWISPGNPDFMIESSETKRN